MACVNINTTMRLYYAGGGDVLAGSSVEIKSFNANLGTGNSSSSIDLDLVYNQCSNIGTPDLQAGYAVIFECNSFRFGGFIDQIEYTQSEAGLGWKVKISDPRKFLDQIQVILNGYYCDIALSNCINVNYLLQLNSAGSACAGIVAPEVQLPSMSSQCSGYGNGKLLGGKASYASALFAIQNLYGLPFKTIYGTSIFYNLSPLIILANGISYAGSDSPNISLANLITEICDEAGYDWSVRLNGLTLEFDLFDRRNATSLGGLEALANAYAANGTLISSSYGVEATYAKTSRVVIGDNIQYLKYGDASNNTRMVLGFYDNGTPITANYSQLLGGTTINATLLAAILADQGVLIPNYPTITEREILAIKSSVNEWLLYCQQFPNSLGATIGRACFGEAWSTFESKSLKFVEDYINANIQDAQDEFSDAQAFLAHALGSIRYDLFFKTTYNWLRSWANEFYGKKWQISLNTYLCYKGYLNTDGTLSGDTQARMQSDEISDAGWTDSPTVLSLSRGTGDMSLFENNDGRIKAFVAIPTTFFRVIPWPTGNVAYYLDPAKINKEFFVKGLYAYFPISVDNKIYRSGYTSIGVLVTTPFFGLTPFNNSKTATGLNILNKYLADNISSASTIQTSIGDTKDFNILGSAASAAGVFSHYCIPFKSNTYVYGPWVSSNGTGGTEIVINKDLNPWAHEGSALMSVRGAALASDGLSSQTLTSSGTLVVAEAPGRSLGLVAGYTGLILSGVSVSFGASGATTTYSFQTFAQKFGNYNRELDARIKATVGLKREVYDNIRSTRQKNLSQLNEARKTSFAALINSLNEFELSETNPASANSTTQISYVFGSWTHTYESEQSFNGGSGGGASGAQTKDPLELYQICDYNNSPTFANGTPGSSNDKTPKAQVAFDKRYAGTHYADSENFNKHAISSLDAILTPVSILGSNGLPGFAQSSYNLPSEFANRSRPVMPPFNTGGSSVGNMPINGKYLNPMTSVAIMNTWDDRDAGSGKGFNISFIAFGTDPTKLIGDESAKQAATDFRFNALKGPLVLQGWGYDTEGKPIPNMVDDPQSCALGNFKKNGLYDQFMPNWQSDPRLWPVGPIDLRWDRDRGVWVSPPSERLVVAQLLSDLEPLSSCLAILLNPTSGGGSFYENYDIYGPQGQHITQDITGAKITVNDFLGRKLCKGTVVYAYHYGGTKYLALETSVVDESECPLCEDNSSSSSDSSGSSASSDSSGSSASSDSSGSSASSDSSGSSDGAGSSSSDSSGSSSSDSSGSSSSDGAGSSSSDGAGSSSSSGEECNACGLLDCFETIYGGSLAGVSGVLGVADNCLTIYPITSCPSEAYPSTPETPSPTPESENPTPETPSPTPETETPT